MVLSPHLARGLGLGLGAALGLTGCQDAFGTRDAHQPGQALGKYHVTATRTANSCGEGALGSTPTWAFDVQLSRDRGTLFWNNGAQVISGAGASDGTSFELDADVVMDMRKDGSKGPPCSVNRHDAAAIELSGAGADVASFSGSLAFSFAPTAGSECGDLVVGGSSDPKAVPVFVDLPCGFSYSMKADRTAAAP